MIKGLPERLFRAFPYLLAALLWIILASYGQYYLKKVEDLSLFLFDWQYLKDSIRIPGGFLGIAGAFLTQFLYLPWLGSLIWVMILLIIYQLTVKAFRIPEKFMILAIIPAVLLIIANMSLGYGVFIMREQDHFFAPALGYLAALVPLFAIRRIKSLPGIILFLVIWTAIGFMLLGAFALSGTLAAAVAGLSDKSASWKSRITVFTTGIALVLLIPLVLFNCYTTYRLSYSWQLGLPAISEESWTRTMRTPFQLALLYLPIMAIVSGRLKDSARTALLQTVTIAISVAAVWGFWFKDSNFRTELGMSEAVDRFDWEQVIDIYQNAVMSHAQSDSKAYSDRTRKLAGVKDPKLINDIVDSYNDRFFEPTRTMVLYRDLALLKMDRAFDDAFTMKDGSRLQDSRTQIPMAFQSGKQFYFQYGLTNLCYRWCLEDAVEHGWNAGTLRYMSLLAILTGEQEMASKFLTKLSRTLFHRKWAVRNLRLAADTSLSASEIPYSTILPLMCFNDNMSNDMGKCETLLISHFTRKRPENATQDYDKTALFWAMRLQNIPVFWEKLYNYLNSCRPSDIPRSIQEAALLYNSLEKNGIELPYDRAVRDSYNSFTRFSESNKVRSIKESRYTYSKQFGKTFYYYYYFMRDLQTY